MKKEKFVNKSKGITLIALIITIIIMLILVGVSVSVALNGGLFSTAQNAADKTQIAAEKEQLLELAMGVIKKDGKVDYTKLDDVIQKDGRFTGSKGIYTSNKSGNIYTITEKLEIKSLEETGSKIINVKDAATYEYASEAAKGDGVTDDRAAIIAAFEYAVDNLPAVVYFPEGEYTIYEDGMYINVPLGEGGLTVLGADREKSTIKYAEDWTTKGQWVALRIQPESTPLTTDEYIHDITITNLGVYDTDPVGHAWLKKDKGNAAEETHGFDIQYCKNATIKNCKVSNVGDEAIDMIFCEDSVIANNYVENSPGAGAAGAAISIGNGCKNLDIIGNTVEGTLDNPLEIDRDGDGITDATSNYGIGIEALDYENSKSWLIQDIQISDNIISNIEGNGINIAAPDVATTQEVPKVENVVIENNNVNNCINGIRITDLGIKNNIELNDNTISNIQKGIIIGVSNVSELTIDGFRISNASNRAIEVGGATGTIISNGHIENTGVTAIYNEAEGTKVSNVTIDGTGLNGDVTSAAIIGALSGNNTLKGDCEVDNINLTNCKNGSGFNEVKKVTNTNVSQPANNKKETFISIKNANYIENCNVDGYIYYTAQNTQENPGKILNVTVNCDVNPTLAPITLSGATYCTVENCRIKAPQYTMYSIRELTTANYNTIKDNKIYRVSDTECLVNKLGANTTETNTQYFSAAEF